MVHPPRTCAVCHAVVAAGARVCPSCGALQAASAVSELAPGITIDRGYGRIVIDARIGEGGMGVVYRAWLFYPPTDPRAADPPQPIAVKALRPEARAQAEVRRFFRNEIEAIRHLSHPNIVRFLDVFEWPAGSESDGDGGSTVLAMELVEGEALVEVITRHVARSKISAGSTLPGLPFLRAWYYFQQLLGALAAIHKVGIVHRDVKPANVLVRRDGVVKLTDFGIARVELRGRTAPHERAIAPGTGAYMSPEQVQGLRLDGRSDLYSAAIVLYEMLAGRPPFSPEGKSEIFIRQEQIGNQPPPIRTFVAQAPPVLDALFARALAKDPAVRFEDALQMGEAFRAGLGLPESPEWSAQRELADIAVASAGPQGPAPKRAATLRDFLVERYRTAKMAQR